MSELPKTWPWVLMCADLQAHEVLNQWFSCGPGENLIHWPSWKISGFHLLLMRTLSTDHYEHQWFSCGPDENLFNWTSWKINGFDWVLVRILSNDHYENKCFPCGPGESHIHWTWWKINTFHWVLMRTISIDHYENKCFHVVLMGALSTEPHEKSMVFIWSWWEPYPLIIMKTNLQIKLFD